MTEVVSIAALAAVVWVALLVAIVVGDVEES